MERQIMILSRAEIATTFLMADLRAIILTATQEVMSVLTAKRFTSANFEYYECGEEIN